MEEISVSTSKVNSSFKRNVPQDNNLKYAVAEGATYIMYHKAIHDFSFRSNNSFKFILLIFIFKISYTQENQ